MKKKALISGIAILVLALAIGGTVAYFTSRDSGGNTFEFGSVKIELTEDSWKPDADHVIKGGASFDKDPEVKNVGENDAYVRVHVKMTDYDEVKAMLGGEEPDSVLSGIDPNKWTKSGGEVKNNEVTYTYTYKEILPVSESTGPLFSKVEFPAGLDPATVQTIGDNFLITVNADAVQTSGFGNVEEAFEAFDNESN